MDLINHQDAVEIENHQNTEDDVGAGEKLINNSNGENDSTFPSVSDEKNQNYWISTDDLVSPPVSEGYNPRREISDSLVEQQRRVPNKPSSLSSPSLLSSSSHDESTPLLSGVKTRAGEKEEMERVNFCRRRKYCIVCCNLSVLIVALLIYFVVYHQTHGSCEDPGKLAHGRFQCSSKEMVPSSGGGGGSYSDGTRCLLACDEGYGVRKGSASLICHNHRWLPQVPRCEQLKKCQLLPAPANNGTLNCTDANYEMSRCHFSCPQHYRLRSDSNIFSIPANSTLCQLATDDQRQPQWVAGEPYCEKVVECPPLSKVKDGEFTCLHPKSYGDDEATNTNGSVCALTCTSPHQDVFGARVVRCNEEGSWNATAGQCRQACPELKLKAHLHASCTNGRLPQSTCTMECDPGFVLVGDQWLECSKKTMSWNKELPTCRCPSCKTGEQCQYSIMWTDAIKDIDQGIARYGEHDISCKKTVPPAGYDGPSVQCRDHTSSLQQQCNSLNSTTSFSTVAEQTLATLILKSVYNGDYPLPCDAQLMPKPCAKLTSKRKT